MDNTTVNGRQMYHGSPVFKAMVKFFDKMPNDWHEQMLQYMGKTITVYREVNGRGVIIYTQLYDENGRETREWLYTPEQLILEPEEECKEQNPEINKSQKPYSELSQAFQAILQPNGYGWDSQEIYNFINPIGLTSNLDDLT